MADACRDGIAGAGGVITVVTWNLWWRFGAWQRRRDAILAALGAARPDICGLQEVWATPEENLAGWLAERLGLQSIFAASPAPERWQRRIDDPTIQVGNAILSRWPITGRVVEPLPQVRRRPPLRPVPARGCRRPQRRTRR
jgi:endonuclease/exonuclease/phosphatase family metal-dependent hydrolase